MNFDFLYNLTMDDEIDEKAADLLIERDIELYLTENKVFSKRVYSMLEDVAKDCKECEAYRLANESYNEDSEYIDKIENYSAKQFLIHILDRIGRDSVEEIAVVIRVMLPKFKEKYDLENKNNEKICSKSNQR